MLHPLYHQLWTLRDLDRLILTEECSKLCQKTECASLFRNIPVTSLASNKWDAFISELVPKAPMLLHILNTLVSFNDKRNKTKFGSSHYPGICAAVAILLKERSQHMNGIQSLVSALMYSCHCEKQVNSIIIIHTIICS